MSCSPTASTDPVVSVNAVVVLCTCPDNSVAERIAQALVNEHLAACVNHVCGVRSIYRWQGEVHAGEETLLLIKTTPDCFEAVTARIVELHPYALPEVIALDVAAGLDRYLAWIAHETRAN